jgi:hypothetical protein
MPLRLDNAKSVAHMPTADQQQTKKDFKPRFKVDPAASPMPEIRLPERLAPGRNQIGMVGEIISESWARSNRYTRAKSSESARDFVLAGRMSTSGRTIAMGRARQTVICAQETAPSREDVRGGCPSAALRVLRL